MVLHPEELSLADWCSTVAMRKRKDLVRLRAVVIHGHDLWHLQLFSNI
jgi:hypothetical protein